jgi:prepilin-type N-terminal cleavage/methylation domain-containing protein
MRTARGFSLLEMMVVVAIVGILSAMGLSALELMNARASPQNAAADFSGALSAAHNRAVERSIDVYVVIYPNRGPTGAVGNGSYFVIEDRALNFRTTTPAVNYTNFNPPAVLHPPVAVGRVLEEVYLDRYPKRTVRFGATGTLPFQAPFIGLANGVDCSFCGGSGASRRGAIAFHADGTAGFLDHTGAPVAVGGATALARAASIGLVSTDLSRQYLFAVSSAVSHLALVSK